MTTVKKLLTCVAVCGLALIVGCPSNLLERDHEIDAFIGWNNHQGD